MSNKYKIGILSVVLGSTMSGHLPADVFADDTPAVCTKAQFDPWACYWLEGKITEGMCGAVLKPDIPRIEAAAEQDNHAAAYRMGQLYASSTWGVERDYAQAHQWLLRAANGGNRDGQIELARLYEFGRGVEKDLEQALHWYEQAVSRGPYKGLHEKIDYLRKKLRDGE
jgi:TPR repeat protein